MSGLTFINCFIVIMSLALIIPFIYRLYLEHKIAKYEKSHPKPLILDTPKEIDEDNWSEDYYYNEEYDEDDPPELGD